MVHVYGAERMDILKITKLTLCLELASSASGVIVKTVTITQKKKFEVAITVV